MRKEIETNTEKVIDYLLKCKIENNQIYLALNAYSSVEGISDKEFTDILNDLNDLRFIEVKYVSGNNQTNSPCYITPKVTLKEYFPNKMNSIKAEKKKARKEAFRFWVPTLISLFALGFSMFTFFTRE